MDMLFVCIHYPYTNNDKICTDYIQLTSLNMPRGCENLVTILWQSKCLGCPNLDAVDCTIHFIYQG